MTEYPVVALEEHVDNQTLIGALFENATAVIQRVIQSYPNVSDFLS